jgi:hypothetical protein
VDPVVVCPIDPEIVGRCTSVQITLPGSQATPHTPALQMASPPNGLGQVVQAAPQQAGSLAMSTQAKPSLV